VRVERSTSNTPPPQKEYIQTQSAGHDLPERDNVTSSFLAGMHIQFSTLTFHSRSKEQLQEYLCLKKSTTSLSAAIEALGNASPLGPHSESDLATYLYSNSTPIVIMDEFDRWISVNNLKKFVTSLLVAIGALGSTLGSRPERYLATYLHSGSTPIGIKDEYNRRIRYRQLQEIYNITIRGDQGIELSSRNPSKNRSHYRSIIWLRPSSPL
jgi:hypothetical protein